MYYMTITIIDINSTNRGTWNFDLDPILLKVWMKAEETLLSDDTELAGKANMFDES